MKVYKAFIILIVCVCYGSSVFGQQSIGLTINGGLSYLSTKIFQTGSEKTTQSFYFMPSGQAGIYYNYSFGKSLLGAEVLFNQVEGKEHASTPEYSNGQITGKYMTTDYSRHISYLSIPIYYGYSFGKLTVNLGLQTSLLLYSTMQSIARDAYNGTQVTYYLKSTVPVKDGDFGARVSLFYRLSNKFSVQAAYYCGLVNIYKYPYLSDSYRAQQITLGLRYTFLHVKKKESE